MPRGRPPKSKQTEAEQSEPDAEMEAEPDPAQNAAASDEPTRRSGRARKPNMRYSGDFITDFKAPLPEPEPAAVVATEPGKRGRKSKKASLDGEDEVKVEEPEQQEEEGVKPEKPFKAPLAKRKSTEKKQKEKKKKQVEETPPPVLDREWSPDDDVPILNKKRKADEPVRESRESSSSSSSSSSLSSSPSPSPSPVQKQEVNEEPAESSPAPVVEKLEKTSSAHREESVEDNRHKSPEAEPKRHRHKRSRVVIPFDDDTSEDWAPPEKRAPKEKSLATPKTADVTPSHPSTSRDLRNDIAMSVKEKKRHSTSSAMTPSAPFRPKPPSSASSSRPIINPAPVKQTITEMWAQKFQELKKNRAPAGSEVIQAKPVQGLNESAEVTPAAQKETTSSKPEGEKKQVLKKQRSAAASSTTLPSPTAAKSATDNLLDAIIDNQTQLINLEAKKQREQELEELKRKNAAIYGNQTASTSASMLGRPPPSVPSYNPTSANHLPVRVPPPPPPKPKNLSVPPPPPKKPAPAATQSATGQWVKPPSSTTAAALPPPPPPKKPPPPSQSSGGGSSNNQSNAVSSSSAHSSTDVPKPVNNASKLPIPPPPPPKKKPEQTVAPQQQVVSTTTNAAPEQAKTSEKKDDIPPPPAPRQSSTEPDKQERRTRISRWDIMVPKQVLMAAASSNSPLPQFTLPLPSIPVSVPTPVPPPFAANSVTSPVQRPASPIDPLVIARSTPSPVSASLLLPPPPPPPTVGGTEQETQEKKTTSPEKAKELEQEETGGAQVDEITEYGPELPPQAESQEEELQKSNEKETIQLGQEQNKDEETEEAIESEGSEKKQQEDGDGLPKALSLDRRLSIKERLKQMQMMDDNQEEEYDPLAAMDQEQLGEKANESVLSAYVPSAVDANATRLTSIDDEDEVFGEQEAEDEMEDEEDDEEDIEEEEQKEEFDEDESVESSKDAESTDKERQTDDDSQQGKENEDNVVDPKTLNPLELLSKAKDVLTKLTIEEESTQQPEPETQGPYSQVHLDREEVDTPEPTEKELPEFHGEPVPDDDEYLFQVAAGIKPTKKKKDLVIEEEDLPSEEIIEPDYYNADLHIKGTTNKPWLLEPENADGLALMWGGVRSNFAVKTPLVHPIKSEPNTEDGGESSDKHKIGFQIKILEKLPLKHLPFEETDPYDVRVGFSTADTPTILGEYATSYCYTATAKKANNNIFLDYGETFDQDDVITAVFDLVSGEIIFYKNGVCLDLSSTHRFSEEEELFFPHVCTKNCKVAINYGDNPEGEHLWPIPEGCNFTFFNQIDRRNLLRTKMPPDDKSKCTLLMMVGLPGVGKTTWVKQYLRDHDDEHWIHICAENVLQAMRVNGKSRRTVKNIRWDMVLGLVGKSLQRLVQLAARRRHNYILDMSNTARETRKRRLSLFTGFQKKCLVLMPSEEEMKERQARQARAEGMPIIPTEAMLEMKAILSLPSSDEEPIDWVHFIEPPMERINEVIAMVAQFNNEGRPWYQKKYRKKWRAHRNSFGGSIVPASAPGPSSGPHSFTHTSHTPHQQYQHRPQHFNQNQNQEPRLLPLSRQSSNYPNLHVVITDLDSSSGQPMPLSSSGYSGGYSRSSSESTPQHTPGLNSFLAKFSACPFKP